MSNKTITDLVAVAAGVLGLAVYAGLILAPAWSAYSRVWERLAASFLSLYVFGVLVGVGVLGALVIVYNWG
jgi:O-antigen ligase